MRKRSLPALLFVATVLAAAGCAGRGEATGNTDADREAQLLKFAQCMRDHGVDMPDPETDSKGNLKIVRPGRASEKPPSRAERSKFEAAQKACEKYQPFQQLTPEERAQAEDNALKFAQCMRSKGFDVPDPDFSAQQGSGNRRVQTFGGNINPRDPKVRTALDDCREKTFGDGPAMFGFRARPG